ncbi:H+transporting two-sector ATPase B/B' subunit [Parvibaculum lavamentivorans DS-1]|uniref:ATP synthase subunit b 2 n=1 Tax=Parvibaculum lavamentivorans (strain DS-1 / DSM 13023 / NCIMB 13966) TaxID=402881 RepID=ATPF2_PARL1|nr:F0F1 ATP synthase subunit B [Parvibaculum lavamentivorans]A7HQY5.1 RecName: Full=ATP synthase subunit b 2; AltName: Full=ATP synthase F(0) sector subunit b 2; AltName: Full=ATPase subunit I 2; AltName: Full=F-type ATPase subunit b 2; Short=F-ATPase subunit b 2 [Parvibaculum lavamentivorans DS-1]ABS62318.1 H+transporting two-sector ATPase B/B' subunit [Parvibaculum lavamentivorans DS-1]
MIAEAMAQEPGSELISETQVPDAEHAGGFPPFDAASFESQLVWLVLSFAALYLLMSRVALPRIANVLEERRDRIADDLDQAAQFQLQTEEAIGAYEKALAEARAKAQGIAQETRDRLQEETERQRLAIEARLAEKISEAEKQIAATKDAALQNVRAVAVDVADTIVAQLLGDSDRSATERAVDTELS